MSNVTNSSSNPLQGYSINQLLKAWEGRLPKTAPELAQVPKADLEAELNRRGALKGDQLQLNSYYPPCKPQPQQQQQEPDQIDDQNKRAVERYGDDVWDGEASTVTIPKWLLSDLISVCDCYVSHVKSFFKGGTLENHPDPNAVASLKADAVRAAEIAKHFLESS